MTAQWDPAKYLEFAGPRLQPAVDLLARVPLAAPAAVYDLGCGAGNVTRLLAQRWPGASVTGVDASPAMLKVAAKAAPGVRWVEADLQAWTPSQPADLIYSNAALHWLGNHDRVFPALLAGLKPGGVLAVQLPRNFGAPSHTLITDAARSGPWREKLEPLLRPNPVAEPSFYFDLLFPRTAALDIWEIEYLQVLQGVDPVKEWVKGSWLVPLLAALDEPDRAGFEARYAELTARAYPRRPDGRTLFPFLRLFIVARAR